MIEEYFDCGTCATEVDPVAALPECAQCQDTGCDKCLDQESNCVPCSDVSFQI